jgi:hypothetical protein
MKFVLAASNRYWWPVTVRAPHPTEAGKIEEQTFNIQIEPMPRDEGIKQSEILSGLTAMKDIAAHEHEQLRTVCKNWDGVVDDDENPVAFTLENFDAALQQPWFRTGLYRALAESQSGEEARLGN